MRAASNTLPTMENLLTGFDGDITTDYGEQWWIRARADRDDYRVPLRAMQTNPESGARLAVCVLCEAGVNETTQHTFVDCTGEWTRGRKRRFCDLVAAALVRADLAESLNEATDAAGALWAGLYADNPAGARWYNMVGLYNGSTINTILEAAEFEDLRPRKNKEKKTLRAALIQFGAEVWEQRRQALTANRRREGTPSGLRGETQSFSVDTTTDHTSD
jgi:hypothetical protein